MRPAVCAEDHCESSRLAESQPAAKNISPTGCRHSRMTTARSSLPPRTRNAPSITCTSCSRNSKPRAALGAAGRPDHHADHVADDDVVVDGDLIGGGAGDGDGDGGKRRNAYERANASNGP